MKRALAALAFGLAACSSGGGSGAPVQAASAATQPTTSTTAADPTEVFLQQIGSQLDGENQAFKDEAVKLSRSMCDLLDQTVNGPAQEDAANDSAASDAAISNQLTKAALDTASNTGLDPTITAIVLRAGADSFCPKYSALVDAYAAGLS